MWILLIIVLAGVFYVLTNPSNRQRPSKSGETPLDIAQQRYARGEITQDEYEQMKHDLKP